MSSETIVNSLLQGIEFDDPRLYDLLSKLSRDLYGVVNELHPPTSRSFGITGQLGTTNNITGFSATIFPRNLRLTWASLEGITTYEIRYNSGNNNTWDGADVILRTTTNSADIDPVQVPLTIGDHTFLIKAISSSGVESETASSVLVNIPKPSTPVVTAIVIDNFVLLTWTEPDSVFAIEHYHVYKDGVALGNMNGTFEAIFETVAGTYEYSIEAADIIDNHSDLGVVTAEVKQPPDFELQDSQVSALGGTKTNVVLEDTHLVCCVTTGEAYEDHFINNSWDTIQDQIDAGYPIYVEPSETSGSYEEVFDFGTILSNNIVSVRWNELTISGSVSIVCKIAVSDDNITYDSFVTASSRFAASLRYAKVRLEFTGSTDKSLLLLSNLNVVLDVKREMDAGTASAVSTDASGTEVFFNKSFHSVDSITVTPLSTVLRTAIYDFSGGADPTSFFVYLFDSGGSRVSGDVSWKARGVV